MSSLRAPVASLLLLDAYVGMMQALGAASSPYVAATFGLSASRLALLFAAASGGSLLALLAGRHFHKLGRKGTLLAACLACYVLAPIAALSPNVYAYAACLILVCAGASTAHTMCVIMMYEQLPPHQRARGQSLLGIARAVGGGGALGLIAIAHAAGIGWRGAWAICCYPIVLHVFFRKHLRETASQVAADSSEHMLGKEMRAVLSQPDSARLLVFAALWAMATATLSQWLYHHSIVALGLTEGAVTLLIGGAGLLSFAGFFVAERLAASYGRMKTMALCGVVSMVAGLTYYAVPSVDNPVVFCFLAALLIIDFGLSNAVISTFQGVVNAAYPARLRARALGAMQLVGAVAAIAGQLLVAGSVGVFGSLLVPILLIGALKMPACLVMVVRFGRSGQARNAVGSAEPRH